MGLFRSFPTGWDLPEVLVLGLSSCIAWKSMCITFRKVAFSKPQKYDKYVEFSDQGSMWWPRLACSWPCSVLTIGPLIHFTSRIPATACRVSKVKIGIVKLRWIRKIDNSYISNVSITNQVQWSLMRIWGKLELKKEHCLFVVVFSPVRSLTWPTTYGCGLATAWYWGIANFAKGIVWSFGLLKYKFIKVSFCPPVLFSLSITGLHFYPLIYNCISSLARFFYANSLNYSWNAFYVYYYILYLGRGCLRLERLEKA